MCAVKKNLTSCFAVQYTDSRAEQSRAEQSRAEQSRAEQSRAEQSRAEQSRAEQSRVSKTLRFFAAKNYYFVIEDTP